MKIRLLSVLLGATVAAVLSFQAHAVDKEPLVFYGVSVEQLEYRFGDDGDIVAWDGDAFVGTDEWKLKLQSEAEFEERDDKYETLETQVFVQRLIGTFWDAKAGVRFDTPDGPDRTYGMVGLHGLAPQWFEVDADLFLSEKGDASARLDVDYELLLTNWLILTPTAEVDFAFSDDREIGVGAGISKAEVGLRLSYDLLERSVAPYIGTHYERKFGETGRLAEADGEDKDAWFFVAGLRLLF
tara:strand:+ start:290 stop:1012 length:723 start_codon:yes stop_codon:yes gene_type:complete